MQTKMTAMMKLVDKDFEITIIMYVKKFGRNINVGENMEKIQKVNVNSRIKIKGNFQK